MQVQMKIGTTTAQLTSLAAGLDLVAMWSDNPSRAVIGRLCAAAIGLTCEAFRLPPYKLNQADPVLYGGKCLNLLLMQGVTAPEIYHKGSELLLWISQQLPSQPEVEDIKKNGNPQPDD